MTTNGVTKDDLAGLVLGRLETLSRELRELRDVVLEGRPPGSKIDDFADIDPERYYTLRELSKLPGRVSAHSTLYDAVRDKKLTETLTGGVMRVKGEHYIAWLRSRRSSRKKVRAKASKKQGG